MNRRLTLLAAFSLLAALPVSQAFAWDSATRPAQHNLPGEAAKFYPYTAPSQPRHWVMEVVKDRVGVVSAGGGPVDRGVSTLFSCAATFDQTKDLSECAVGTNDMLARAQWGWLQLRLAADGDEFSEHFLIAQEAARQAGLLSSSKIFHPFFIRYASRNARLVSPTNLVSIDGRALRVPNSPLVLGQSWEPTAIGTAEAHAVREISLLELAQLPDSSSSMGDWAAGNELCPFSGLDGAFDGSLPPAQVCHSFEHVLGAVNVTHFAELNRQMWEHYHEMAKNRMAECEGLVPLTSPFYSEQYALGNQTLGRNEPRVSIDDTEAHECEREAMAYEMFAQHFLQDAWSTGHMWKRWGKSELSQYPDDFSVFNWVGTPELGPEFSPEEVAPRQATIALVVAAISGTVHGAKPRLNAIARSWFGIANYLLSPWVSDDPLNGPTYFEPTYPKDQTFLNTIHPPSQVRKKIYWLNANGLARPGAGDEFWAPAAPSQGAVSNAAEWKEQRDTMLGCAAASMLQTYLAGSGDDSARVHGRVDRAAWPAGLEGIDPAGPSCWNHWATNEAMRAALGVDFPFDDRSMEGPATFLANTLIFQNRKAQIGFVRDEGPATLVASRDTFLRRLKKRMMSDVDNIRESYVANRESDPNGTASARGLDNDGEPISLINVFPVTDATPTTKLSDSVPFVDQWQPQTADPRSNQPLDMAMSRIFWRGNIIRTCRDSLQNQAAELNALRARCLGAAAGGGDADACTECANLAELHIPYCTSTGDLGPSKCGAVTAGSGTDGLPAWWFDGQARRQGLMGDLPKLVSADACAAPYIVAVDWCTATQEGNAPSFWVDTPQMVQCDKDSSPLYYGTEKRRVGRVLVESGFGTNTWIPQMVIARDETTTQVPDPNPCVLIPKSITHDYDNLIPHGNAPLSERVQGRQGFPEYPRCGTIQRTFGFNRGCGDASAAVGVNLALANGWDPVTGADVAPGNDRGADWCVFSLPREFVSACPQGLECNAGGECVAGGHEPDLIRITPPIPGSE